MYQKKQQPPPLNLKFSVNGKPVVFIKEVDADLALHKYIERALNESTSAWPLEDYNAFYNSRKLDWGEKTSSFKFPDNALIMLSLKTAIGSNKKIWSNSELYIK